ncbi:MAG: tryptophan-tRNA synthetase TrpS [Actinomycetota bacterium]|jgi:tryptophanyl-tRNA synthetase
MTQPRVLSGIQPTADSFQIGNYLGALRYWLDLQATHDSFYMIADLHALTVAPDPKENRERTLKSFAQLIALGIDPEKSTLFVQSQVREHVELMWVLSCLTGFGEAGRMTQFKDKSSKEGNDTASVGLFTYPILQAADILLYQANQVPVGEDQRQHLELTRDLAGRFNHRYGQTFVVPTPHIVKDTAKIVDLQDPTAKMSKSSPSGCVFLLEPLKTIEKKIKSAVTDSETEIRFDVANKAGVSNLLTIESAFTGKSVDQLVAHYSGQMYGALKTNVAQAVLAFAEPFQARVNELMSDPAELQRLMAIGADRASTVAAVTVKSVYEKVGLVQR